MQDLIEKYAIIMALGNNGGELEKVRNMHRTMFGLDGQQWKSC